MENAYGIGITNRYALFIDEEEDGGDPIDILKQAEITADKKIKKVEVPKTNVKPGVRKDVGKRDDVSDKENQRNNQRYEGKRVLDARRAQEGPKEERNNRINQEGGPRRDVDEEGRIRNRGGGRGGGGGGRGMGGGRGRDGPSRGGRGGKREFERKSGDARTGLKAEDKRGGGGKGNWGTMEDDIKGKESGEETGMNTSTDETAAPRGEEDEEKREEGEDQGAKEEEEPKQLTLDEWKALQGKKDQPKFNLRKAGEGSDIDPKWKKAAAYKKEKVQEDEEEEDDENYVYPQRANRQKHLLDIDFHFADQQSSRGGGRGRGRGGRGGRGRGGPRDGGRDGGPRDGGGREGGREGGPRDGGREGGRDGDAPPRRGGKGGRDGQQFSLDDQKAFPALG